MRGYSLWLWSLLLTLALSGLVAAHEATLVLSYDVPTAAQLLVQAGTRRVVHGERLLRYGNWYGPGYWGGSEDPQSPGSRPPVDELDAVAMRHDFAYEIAEEQGRIHGPAEEQRLKAIADAIAVRDAHRLDPDPNNWRPPAPDPKSAEIYRRRMSFGFTYLTLGRFTAAGSGNAPPGGLSVSDLDQQASRRAQEWFRNRQIQPTYRLEIQAERMVLAELETLPLTISLTPVYPESVMGGGSRELATVDLSLSGPGRLSTSRAQVTPVISSGINLEATRRLFGLRSSVGSTIVVHARSEGSPGMDVLPGSATFTVAISTQLSLVSVPEAITQWPREEQGVNIRAHLTTADGRGLSHTPIQIQSEDGRSQELVTDSSGYAFWTLIFHINDLGGEPSRINVVDAAFSGGVRPDGNTYFPATARMPLRLEGPEQRFLRGRVVDGRTLRGEMPQMPVVGARITLDGELGTATTQTSADGHFHVPLTIPMGLDGAEHIPISLKISHPNYNPLEATATLAGGEVHLVMSPLESSLMGQVLDRESRLPIGGAEVQVSEPIPMISFTDADGRFQWDGLYVGDRLSFTTSATGYRSLNRMGILRSQSAQVTIELFPFDDPDDPWEDLPQIVYALGLTAIPANPAPRQAVRVTAQISPAVAGIPVRLSVVGTDGYTNSIVELTNSRGQASLRIPGASAGVFDRVTVTLLGQGTTRTVSYTF